MKNPDFTSICAHFNLGDYQSLSRVPGGGNHYTYHLITTKGEYAIKQLLNDYCDFELCETAASNFKTQGIHAVHAILGQSGKRLFSSNDCKVMVYPWIDGVKINDADASAQQIASLGQLLASMHKHNLRLDGFSYSYQTSGTDESAKMQSEVETAHKNHAPFAELLSTKLESLKQIYTSEQQTKMLLNSELVLCHNDLNAGNIIWIGNTPNLIDWERTRPINKEFSVVHATYLWCMNKPSSLPILLDAYFAAGGTLDMNNALKAFSMLEGDELRWARDNVRRYCDASTSEADKTKCAETVIDVLTNNLGDLLPTIKQHFESYCKSRGLLHI